jgi:hypothetical protein
VTSLASPCEKAVGSDRAPPQREREVDAIVRDLVRQFGDRVPDEHIAAEAQNAYDGLCATAKVETFITILALRRARERVRLLAERVDAAVPSVEVLREPRSRAGEVVDLVDDRFSVRNPGPRRPLRLLWRRPSWP